MLRAFCFENSVKQSLLLWAGGPKPVLMWLREESKHEPRNIVRDSQGHGVLMESTCWAKVSKDAWPEGQLWFCPEALRNLQGNIKNLYDYERGDETEYIHFTISFHRKYLNCPTMKFIVLATI